MPLKCDLCGKFIKEEDFYNKKAFRILETPDSEFTSEEYFTAHQSCYEQTKLAEERIGNK